MVLGIAIGGFLVGNQKSSASSNEEKIENLASEEVIINMDDLPSYSSEAEKEAAYYNFLADFLSLVVENIDGISDCVIDITRSNSELLGANVCITINNSFDNDLETSIQAYVAEALEISVENVKISYK